MRHVDGYQDATIADLGGMDAHCPAYDAVVDEIRRRLRYGAPNVAELHVVSCLSRALFLPCHEPLWLAGRGLGALRCRFLFLGARHGLVCCGIDMIGSAVAHDGIQTCDGIDKGGRDLGRVADDLGKVARRHIQPLAQR